MSSQRAVTTPGLKTTLLILFAIGIFLIGRAVVLDMSPTGQNIAAPQRIMAIALNDRTELVWLAIVCAGAGLMVIADRRRRSRVRQAAC